MKRIRALNGPTPGLVNYLECESNHGSWEGFRSHQRGDAYDELVKALWSIQHGLCGYCEINITESDRQVEHVVPQSAPVQGEVRALDAKNMMVCCKGGTRQNRDDARYLRPLKHNRSCGEAKGNRVDPEFLDPRELPALPTLMRVGYDGRIRADAEACQNASFDVNKVNKTIEILGLNVKRLQLAREKHWRYLSEEYQELFDDPQIIQDNPQIIQEAARMELLPGKDNRLPPFFSTSRSYFGPVAEKILEEAPQEWI